MNDNQTQTPAPSAPAPTTKNSLLNSIAGSGASQAQEPSEAASQSQPAASEGSGNGSVQDQGQENGLQGTQGQQQEPPKEGGSEERNILDDWDTDGPSDQQHTTSADSDKPAPNIGEETINVLELSRQTGEIFGSVKELVTKYTALKERVETLEKNGGVSDPLLKEADEAAKSGVNPLEYLGIASIDFDKIPDVELLRTHYVENGRMTEDAFKESIGQMTDAEIKRAGADVRFQFKQAKEQKMNSLREDARRRKAENQQHLKEALQGFNDLHGFKMQPHHKTELMRLVESGDIGKSLFFDKNGKLDHKAVIELAAYRMYGEKIFKAVRSSASNSAKADMVRGMSNAQPITRGSTPAKAEPTDPIMGLMSHHRKR